MAQAFCIECGADVELDASGSCPAAHPTTSYRYALPVQPADSTPAVFHPPAVPDIELSAGWKEPSGPHPWMFAAAFAVMGIAVVAIAVTVVAPRLRAPRPPVANAAVETSPTAGESVAVPLPVQLPVSPGSPAFAPFPNKRVVRPSSWEQRQWALATSAILARANAERHDTLAGKQRTTANIAAAKESLAESWDIGGQKDLLGRLDEIERGRGRRSFESFVAALAKATPEQLDAIAARSARDSQYAEQVYIARIYGLPDRNRMVAWDLGCYVYLCRQGYLAGYLSESEAWQRIMTAARSLQGDFSSWRDFGDNFILGAKFWSQNPESTAAQQAAETFLLESRYGPWRTLSWDTSLRAR